MIYLIPKLKLVASNRLMSMEVSRPSTYVSKYSVVLRHASGPFSNVRLLEITQPFDRALNIDVVPVPAGRFPVCKSSRIIVFLDDKMLWLHQFSSFLVDGLRIITSYEEMDHAIIFIVNVATVDLLDDFELSALIKGWYEAQL